MKMTSKNWLAAIGVVLAGTALATEFKKTGFETADGFDDPPPQAVGTVDSPTLGWIATSANSIFVVAVPQGLVTAHSGVGANVVRVPAKTDLYTAPTISGSPRFVWSDFWTIPRLYVSAVAFNVDSTASAQFYLQPIGSGVGNWALVDGKGDGTRKVDDTDILCPQDTEGRSIAYTENGSSWVHVSVLLDYQSHTWSFFINGVLVKKDLGFINAKSPVSLEGPRDASTFRFAMANGNVGGFSDNAWLDDVAIASTVSDLGSGVKPDAVVLSGSGSSSSLQIQSVGNSQSYTVFGGTTVANQPLTLTSDPISGTSYNVPDLEGNPEKYLYKVVVKEGETEIDEQDYIRLSQNRQSGRSYLMTVPLRYSDTDRNLNGLLGTHLAQGLNTAATAPNPGGGADSVQILQNGQFEPYYFYDGTWWDRNALRANVTVSPGAPLMIVCSSAADATRSSAGAVFFGSTLSTDSTTPPSVALTTANKGWNMISWVSAADATPTAWASTIPGSTDGSKANQLAACDVFFRTSNFGTGSGRLLPFVHRPGGWTAGFTVPSKLENYVPPPPMKAGESILYHRVGTDWSNQ